MSRKFLVFFALAIMVVSVVVVWNDAGRCLAQNPQQQAEPGREAADTPQATPPAQLETKAEDDDTASAGTPTISFAEEVHDFGSVTRGAKLTYHFKVRNTGDAPLKIIKAKAG